MEDFTISIGTRRSMQVFEVRNYADQGGNSENGECQFEVFQNGTAVLSLTPEDDTLRTGNNIAGLDEQLIHQIIDKIESHHL